MRLRSVLDRVASWLGYVPAERLVDALSWYDEELEEIPPTALAIPWPCTETTVKTPPAILVASDFKRGIPCS